MSQENDKRYPRLVITSVAKSGSRTNATCVRLIFMDGDVPREIELPIFTRAGIRIENEGCCLALFVPDQFFDAIIQ